MSPAPIRRATALAAAGWLAACFGLSGPRSGLSSISPILAAWPSVVVGDVLRDESGAVAPLRVDAYDGDGNLVTDATVAFILLAPGVRVDPDRVVHGETVDSRARLVAQVRRGGDVLQSPEDTIDVVPQPDSVTPAQDTTFAEKAIPRSDSPVPSDELTVRVLNKGANKPVRSWIVRYEILEQPEGFNNQRTALFPGAGNDTVTVDTTDASGIASRRIDLQRALLAAGDARVEVRVRATVPRAGPNGTARTITFTLPFVRQ